MYTVHDLPASIRQNQRMYTSKHQHDNMTK